MQAKTAVFSFNKKVDKYVPLKPGDEVDVKFFGTNPGIVRARFVAFNPASRIATFSTRDADMVILNFTSENGTLIGPKRHIQTAFQLLDTQGYLVAVEPLQLTRLTKALTAVDEPVQVGKSFTHKTSGRIYDVTHISAGGHLVLERVNRNGEHQTIVLHSGNDELSVALGVKWK